MTAAEILAALEAPFTPDQIRQRVGRGGIQLSWVDARTVAARLDAVLGLSGWSWHIERQQDGVVLGTLTVTLPDGTTVVRQDYGYMTGGSGEDLKEAASDCLRRCASLYGVGRSLYQHGAHAEVPALMPRQPRAAVAPAQYDEAAAATERTMLEKAHALFGKANAEIEGGATCPAHATAWVLRPSGVSSKTGREYPAFYACTSRDGDGYCRRRPAAAWIAAQSTPSAPASDDSSSLEALPF